MTTHPDDPAGKRAQFRKLHDRIFVMPNVWDAGSARILAPMGFSALATTSAGYAYSAGLQDLARLITREAIIENARAIVAATDLPVSADLQNGFGPAPEDCAETIRQAIAIGLAGGSIEDVTEDAAAPVFEIGLAADRVRAAAEVAKGAGFVLTARADGLLWGQTELADIIARLQAYAEAGADVLFAPGLTDADAIRRVCASVDKPVNVLMGLSGAALRIDELAAAGARRISTGGSLMRAAMGELQRAAAAIRGQGDFSYAARAMPGAAIDALMSDRRGD
ncbi:isocitrate lyase/PEP mutase family protein [Paracoccus pacificus]|uniref:Oxaloacetate decarboxylase n=1 Tax=Paracoccus pacificus TaxID=1463598 RepID=A0ABW4RD42_9RHOB